jgi:hypothetical protein
MGNQLPISVAVTEFGVERTMVLGLRFLQGEDIESEEEILISNAILHDIVKVESAGRGRLGRPCHRPRVQWEWVNRLIARC